VEGVLTVGMVVAIVATTVALAPAITLCFHTNEKCKLKPCNFQIVYKLINAHKMLNHIHTRSKTYQSRHKIRERKQNVFTLSKYTLITMRAALGHGQLLI